jgi:hypothetical protein
MALRKNNVILYGKIQARFKELFEVKKLRYEYCIETLSNEFYKATVTIGHILRLDLPKEVELPKGQNKERNGM